MINRFRCIKIVIDNSSSGAIYRMFSPLPGQTYAQWSFVASYIGTTTLIEDIQIPVDQEKARIKITHPQV